MDERCNITINELNNYNLVYCKTIYDISAIYLAYNHYVRVNSNLGYCDYDYGLSKSKLSMS